MLVGVAGIGRSLTRFSRDRKLSLAAPDIVERDEQQHTTDESEHDDCASFGNVATEYFVQHGSGKKGGASSVNFRDVLAVI